MASQDLPPLTDPTKPNEAPWPKTVVPVDFVEAGWSSLIAYSTPLTSQNKLEQSSPGRQPTSLQVEVGIYDLADNYSGVTYSNSLFNPDHPQRDLLVTLSNSSNVVTYSNWHQVQYSSTKKAFTGSVNLGNFSSGHYTVRLKLRNTLSGRVPGIVTIGQAATITLPRTLLQLGDVNGDNTRNLLDYNLLMGCYSDFYPPPNCPAGRKPLADLNDDGDVNQFDYNTIVRAFANTPGG
jgi:hypothetical protein